MNEAETRAEHIDPALAAAGWGVVEGSRVLREFGITQGRLQGGGKRARAEVADYVLVYRNTRLAVKLFFLVKKPSVTKRGLSWKKLTKIKLLSRALSTVKLKAVSLLKLTVYARSCQVLWLTYVQYATLLTWKVKSLNSK